MLKNIDIENFVERNSNRCVNFDMQCGFDRGLEDGAKFAVCEIIDDLSKMLSVSKPDKLEDNIKQFIRNYKDEFEELF